jgi:flagellar FliL protein
MREMDFLFLKVFHGGINCRFLNGLQFRLSHYSSPDKFSFGARIAFLPAMANPLEKEATTAASGKNSPRKPRSKGITTAAVATLAIGFGIWWGFVRPRDVDSASRVGAASARAVVPLEAFTVNLADHEEGRFLRATLALSVEGQLPTIARGENKPVETAQVSMATIRDSIITVLAQCKSDELLTPEGKAKLKADLISSLNRDVPELRVRDVFFTEFLVQR